MNSGSPISAATTRSRHARAYVLMFLVVTFWAANIVAGKEALKDMGTLAVAQTRVLGAAIIYAVWFLASGGMRRVRFSPRLWFLVIMAAITGIALNQITFIAGIARTTTAHSSLIVALGPIMVLVIAVVMRLEALTGWKFAGMLVASGGVAILTADTAGTGSAAHWTGDLIMLASTLVFAIYTVLMKEIAGQADGLTLNTVIFVLGAAFMVLFCGHEFITTPWTRLSLAAWSGVVFLIVFGSVISYMLFADVMTQLPASRAAAFNYLQPVVASGLGMWLLSERLTSKVWVGGSLILAGVYLTERERGEEKASSSERIRHAVQ